MSSLFSIENLINQAGEKVPVASLAGKTLGIYFSAHWCPPCRGFTPKLVEWYANFKKDSPNKDNFELVFISSDRDEAAFKEYHSSMNFLGLPFAERDMKKTLSEKFGISGIPSLVIVDSTGKLITDEGREAVETDPTGANFPWTPQPLPAFDELAPTSKVVRKFLNKPFMLVLTNGSDEDMAAAKSALAPVAEAFRAKDAALNFLYANPKLELTGRVCQFAHLSKDPQLVIINIEESTKCIAADQSITAENLSAFAQAFFEGKLTFGPVKPAPLSLTEALGNEFVNNKGEKFTLADLAGKNLGIYFSAHWCPPCRGFTPLLAKTYKMLKEDPSKPFEIIFVSADQSEKEFQSYFADMPWLTLAPSADLEHRKDSLNTIFDVDGIPTLVMMDPTMEKRNKDAVERVQEDLSGLDFPWLDALVVAELAKVPGGASGKTEKHGCEVAEYQGGGKWLCDECECCPPLNTPRMQCEDCGYDMCMDCWKTEKGGANDPKAEGEEECPGGVCQMPKK